MTPPAPDLTRAAADATTEGGTGAAQKVVTKEEAADMGSTGAAIRAPTEPRVRPTPAPVPRMAARDPRMAVGSETRNASATSVAVAVAAGEVPIPGYESMGCCLTPTRGWKSESCQVHRNLKRWKALKPHGLREILLSNR